MEPQTIDAITRSVAQLGFPVASAVFLLWWVTQKLNGKLDRLLDQLDNLPDRIADRIGDKLEAMLSRKD